MGRRAVARFLALALGVLVVGSGAGVTLANLTSSATLGGNVFTTAASFDTVAPTVSATVVAKTGQYAAGFVAQGGTYYVYANATDGGAFPSGIATIRADVSVLTAGATSVALVAGAFTVEGVSYGYRSAALTVRNPLAAGAKTYTLTSIDNAGNSRLQTGFTTTVDNPAPTASDIQTTNGGATVGRIEPTDTIIYTFSDATAARILAGITPAGGTLPPAARTAVRSWLWFMDGACLDWIEHRDLDRQELRGLLLGTLAGALTAAGVDLSAE